MRADERRWSRIVAVIVVASLPAASVVAEGRSYRALHGLFAPDSMVSSVVVGSDRRVGPFDTRAVGWLTLRSSRQSRHPGCTAVATMPLRGATLAGLGGLGRWSLRGR